MRSLSGSLLQIPRYVVIAFYVCAMAVLFFGSVIAYIPGWAITQIKHQILS